jgi:hypothetical protein
VGNLWETLKIWARKRVLSITIFCYALVVGTAVPIVFSRCTANCLSCGSCGTMVLGIVPVVAGLVMKNRIKQGFNSIQSTFSRLFRVNILGRR